MRINTVIYEDILTLVHNFTLQSNKLGYLATIFAPRSFEKEQTIPSLVKDFACTHYKACYLATSIFV